MSAIFNIKSIVLILFILATSTSYSSVVLVGTRVIYESNKKSVDLKFRSSDTVPSIINLWVTHHEQTPNTNDAPFIITPSIFRIDPNKGQSVKLMFSGENLPDNKESLFYLHFVQLPASDKTANKLLVSYKSTVKLFYRPANLTYKIDDLVSYLKIDTSQLNMGVFTVLNESPFYVTPTKIVISKNSNQLISVPDEELNMIHPFSARQFKVKPYKLEKKLTVYIGLINDLGGISTYEITSK
ncbi:hypothetical protein NAL19_2412 [Pectobacterium sp. F1-1]|uniref:fimbrial biogenesis chaperone n=1 Tax=Pectobacterium sp. F1-1 TaxID=2949614 RepID=UPI0021D7B3E2|nr:molecular chaperone [Pectobacterium sp. F1-1]UYA60543.1 hypothetical protein NAL19_2412 [Pectobacterium sp. F1-1]